MTHPLPKASAVDCHIPPRSDHTPTSLRGESVSYTHPFNQLDIPVLTQAVRHGDQRAFEQLYHAVFAPLYRYLLVCSSGKEQEVQEALQETLIRMARHMKGFDHASDLWNWIRCVGRNALTDQMRQIKRRPRCLPLAPDMDLVQAPTEQDPLGELTHHLDHCLHQLPHAEQTLIQGKYLEAKSHKTLAQEHGLTAKAIESRLARIRKKLKTLILKRLTP
ncbi:MAG: sigma-70 family RNA polymerase sigma factor [Phycisphaeraceae bacterium]|nr:sigma-70 family RNA polymerase sigma factor [Phycisphaeraceae bacterium]